MRLHRLCRLHNNCQTLGRDRFETWCTPVRWDEDDVVSSCREIGEIERLKLYILPPPDRSSSTPFYRPPFLPVSNRDLTIHSPFCGEREHMEPWDCYKGQCARYDYLGCPAWNELSASCTSHNKASLRTAGRIMCLYTDNGLVQQVTMVWNGN